MYYVYLLKEKNTEEVYVGYSENLKQRLTQHKQKSVQTTKSGNYELQFYCAFKSKEKALDFEKYLKHGSGFAFARKRFI